MILMLSGTKEGTEIIVQAARKGYEICAVTATAYGAKMAEKIPGVKVAGNNLNKEGIKKLLTSNNFLAIIDATHPFPSNISNFTRQFCIQKKVPYIRFLREEVELPDNSLIKQVYSWEEAVIEAAKHGDTIFLTTGSNNLEIFLESKQLSGKRIVVRVIPDYKVIEKCQNLGMSPRDIVAMQGPFSKEMNRAQLKMYKASVMITKDSGKVGGTDTKISAALSLKIPVIVIKRTNQENKYQVTDQESVFDILNQVCQK